MYDCVIIGGGITGTLILRQLCAYQLKLLLIEKENDISNGSTLANSAIIHAGYDPIPGTLKAELNVRGNRMFEQICRELDVLFRPVPSLVTAFSTEEMGTIEKLAAQGSSYGVQGVEIIGRQRLCEMEPHISDTAVGALYAPTSAIVEPWGLAIAAAENAVDNGAEIALDQEVIAIEHLQEGFLIHTREGAEYRARVIINAAGVHADTIHNMIAPPEFTMHGRKGNYYVLDMAAARLVKNILFPCPNEKGKGILIIPVIHNKLMLGPDSEYIDNVDDTSTQADALQRVREQVRAYLDIEIPPSLTIRSFAGIRPTTDKGDFIIRESRDVPGFVDVAGIESPGLASSPAIAEYVRDIILKILGSVKPNHSFNPIRRPQVRLRKLPLDQQRELIRQDPRYARIVCKCEKITEAEVVDCIHRNMGARTIKGMKKRVGTGLGRCQSGFCQPEILEILARERQVDRTEILYDRNGSNVLIGKTK